MNLIRGGGRRFNEFAGTNLDRLAGISDVATLAAIAIGTAATSTALANSASTAIAPPGISKVGS